MSSGRDTHWCYQCRRPVQLQGRDIVCLYCGSGFVQELDYSISPLEFVALDSYEDRDERSGLMDAFAAFMRWQFADRNHSHDLRGQYDTNPDYSPGFGPLLIFGGQVPQTFSGNGGFEALFNGAPGIAVTQGNSSDYFIGPGIEELFEQLYANDRRGPPPASRSSIDAIPTVKITQRLLRSDTVLFAKINLNWALKQEKCHVTTFITLTVLSHGLFSTILALYVARNYHHKVQLVEMVQEENVEGVMWDAEKTTERVEDAESSLTCGHFARPGLAPAELEQLRPAHLQGPENKHKIDIQDGFLTSIPLG